MWLINIIVLVIVIANVCVAYALGAIYGASNVLTTVHVVNEETYGTVRKCLENYRDIWANNIVERESITWVLEAEEYAKEYYDEHVKLS